MLRLKDGLIRFQKMSNSQVACCFSGEETLRICVYHDDSTDIVFRCLVNRLCNIMKDDKR